MVINIRLPITYSLTLRGVGKGGSKGSDDLPFFWTNFIHFLYKVLGLRSVQKNF